MAETISVAAVLKILVLDLILSGDNAVVIAMASRSLPPEQQKRAIFWGGAGAIGLRVLATALVAVLLVIPLLRLAGGLLLLWVAVRLLRGGEEEEHVKEGGSLGEAVVTIIAADFVMSLDNMLAVGGASHGSLWLLLTGLLISMGIIMFSSSLIARLMNRFGWLVYGGAAILAWTAGEMILQDRWLQKFYAPSHRVQLTILALITAAVLLTGFLSKGRGDRAEPAAGHDGSED